MSALARNDKPLAKAENTMADSISKGLVICETVLKTKDPVTKEAVKIWEALFVEAGIDRLDILPAFRRFMSREKFFPAPCEIITLARKIRQERIEAEESQRDMERAAEIAEQERLNREAWDALPEDVKQQKLEESRRRRDQIKTEMFRSMDEFDKTNPRRSVPGFVSMADAVRGTVEEVVS